MRPKNLAIFLLTVVTGLLCLRALAAGARASAARPELVAVLNTTPSNPLGGEIWLMDLQGRLARRITKNNYHEEHPKFSPDGSKIVFVRNMGGIANGIGLDPKHNEIFVYDLRAGKESRLTRNDAEDGHPEWSFDGKYIAFHSRRNHPQEKATLWVMEADGSHPRQITTLQSGDLSHLDPNWGPDGQWLAFVNYREADHSRFSRIEKIRLDGSQRTVISSGGKSTRASGAEKGGPLGDTNPSHSPDGAMIWSARRLDNGRIHLFAFGAGAYYPGKSEADMDWPVHPGAVERGPQFSPDGRRIVLTRSAPDAGTQTRQLVLTDPQSSFRRYLTVREDWDVWDPSWDPFAQSGVEKDSGATVVSYNASHAVGVRPLLAQNADGNSVERRSQTPGAVRLATSDARPAEGKSSTSAGYEARWQLDVSSERVLSLTFRLAGKFHSAGPAGGKSLRIQLMDWEKKGWVTVFVQPGISEDRIKIHHEIAPGSFVSQDRQVLLRLVALAAPSASAPTVETDSLSLDVKRN